MKKRKEEILEDLDAKLADCEDNIATAMDINLKVNQSKTHNELRDKLEFVQVMETLSKETKLLTYEFFDLVQNTEKLSRSEVFHTSDEIKMPQEKKYEVENVLFSWKTNHSSVTAMEALSDGSIVLCGETHVRGVSELPHHNKTSGQVIYRNQLRSWAGGLTEIRIGNQQYLALSFEGPKMKNQSLAGRIEFFDVPNSYKRLKSYNPLFATPMRLHAVDSSRLLCQQETNDLSYFNTRDWDLRHSINIDISDQITDMCLVTGNKEEILICLHRGSRGIHAWTLPNKLLWSIDGGLGTMRDINCASITTDGRGHLFVCDEANSCIQLFSTDGLYIGRLVKSGEHGLGDPQLVRWCKKSSSLVIAHSVYEFKSNAYRTHITVMKLTF